MFYSIHSEADVDYLIEERIKYAQSQKAENEDLTRDPHVNISNTNSQNYESINVDSVDTESMEDSDSEEGIQFLDLGECEIIDELDLQELGQIPHTIVTLTEGQVLEEFMLEEEIEFQDMDKCKIVELPDKQGIERCASPEMSMRIACDQEECIEEEICNRSLSKLPKLYKVERSVHKDEIQLETPKINVLEISALSREIKSEMPLEKSESKLVQDVDTSVHAELSLPSETIDLCKIAPVEVSVASRKILGKIPKLHTKWKRILESKLVKRAKPTRLVKRKIPSICRPPPKPPDRQNGLDVKISKRMLSKTYTSEKRVGYRPPPMPSFMLNANREMRNSEKEDRASYRPPPKSPYILDANGEVIGIIENMVPKPKSPPKPPPKSL